MPEQTFTEEEEKWLVEGNAKIFNNAAAIVAQVNRTGPQKNLALAAFAQAKIDLVQSERDAVSPTYTAFIASEEARLDGLLEKTGNI